MADLKIGVSLQLAEKSLREIQGQLVRSVENISPQFKVDIDQRRLARVIVGQQVPKIKVETELPDAQKKLLNQQLREVFDRQQVRRLGFSPGLLKKLKDDLKKALQVKVEADVRAAGAGQDPEGRKEFAAQQAIAAGAEKRIQQILDKLVIATEKRVKFQEDVNAETQRIFQGVQGLRQKVFAEETTEEQRLQILNNLASIQTKLAKDIQTSASERKANAAKLAEKERQLNSEAQILLSQNRNLIATTTPIERDLAETAAKQKLILAAKTQQAADEQRVARQVQQLSRRPIPEATPTSTGPLNIEEENLRKAQKRAAAIAEGETTDRKKIAEAVKERARIEEVLRAIAISSEAPLSEALAAEVRLNLANRAKEAAAERAAKAETDIANAIVARKSVEERLAQKAANLIDLTDKTQQREQALAAAKARQLTLERGFVASDVEIQQAIARRAKDEAILADFVNSQLATSKLNSQAELAYNAALKKALDNQGQIASSSAQIKTAKAQQAKDERALADKIRGQLALSDLPVDTKVTRPTIEAGPAQEEILDARQVEANLIQAKAKLEAEALSRAKIAEAKKREFDQKSADAAAKRFEAEQRDTNNKLTGIAGIQRLFQATVQAAQQEQKQRIEGAAADAKIVAEKVNAANLARALAAEALTRFRDEKEFVLQKRKINQEAIRKLRSINEATLDRPDLFGGRTAAEGGRAGAGGRAPGGEKKDLAAETEATNRKVLQELARRLASEIGLNKITDQELRERGILNSTLRQLVLAEQKKLISAKEADDKDEEKERKRIQRELSKEVNALIKRNSQVLKSTGVGSDITNSMQTLSEVLKQRVRAAQAEGALPGWRDETKAVSNRMIELRKELKDVNARVPAAEQELKRLTRNVTQAAVNVLRLENVGAFQLDINAAERELAVAIKSRNTQQKLVANAVKERARESRRINKELREERKSIRLRRNRFAGGGGGAGRTNTVVFRGAQDIKKFGESLDPQQLSRFTAALHGTAEAGKFASSSLKSYAVDINATRKVIDPLNLSLQAGTSAAYEFGYRAAFAGKRLLEWATPAAFLFRAIGLVREAAQTLVELDTQARRLEFFRADKGVFAQFARGAASYADILKQSEINIQTFLSVSRDQGIAVKDVADALLTTARVGQQVFEVQNNVADSSQRMLSGFAQTVLELVRLENGALSAEQAVRKLNAIQNQFFNRLEEFDEGVGTAAIENVGDIIALVSARTSFSASELANAASRVGAAFASIQDASFAVTISAIGIAAKSTGAEVGRLATGFRQLGTLAVRNADKIREQFGVEIIDPDTGQQTFQGLVSALKEVERLSKIDAGQADELLKLISERRNVGDIRALATAVNELEEEFGDLSSPQAEVALAGKAAELTYLAQRELAESLKGSLASLRSEFDGLIQSLGASDLFTGIISGASSFVKTLGEIVELGQAIPQIVDGLIAVATIKLAPKIAAGLTGFFATAVGRATGSIARAETLQLLKSEKTTIDGINKAKNQGLITTKQATAATSAELGFLEKARVSQERLTIVQKELSILNKEEIKDETQIATLKAESLALERQILAAQKGQVANRQQVASQLSKTNRLVSSNLISTAGFTAVVAGSLFAEDFGNAVAGEDKKLGKALGKGLTGALTGGFIGAQIGSVVPVIGTAIGAGVGAVAGGAYGVISGINEENERISKEQKKRDEALAKRKEAQARQERLINARIARRNELAARQSIEQKRVTRLTNQLERAQLEVQKAQAGSTERAEALNRVTDLQIALEKQKTKAQKEQEEIENRKLALQGRLTELRREETAELQRIGLLQAAITQGLEQRDAVELGIEFDQRKLNVQLAAIRTQIDEELREQQNLDIKLDSKAWEASRQKILDLEAKERKLRFAAELKLIQARRKIVEVAASEAEKQVNAWAKASSQITKAFSKGVQLQFKVADAIQKAGELAGNIFAERGKRFIQLLEAQGTTGEARLQAVISLATSQIRQAQQTNKLAQRELGGTGVAALTDSEDIRNAISRLAKSINAAAARAQSKILNREAAVVDFGIAQVRQQAEAERALFKARIAQTRREIGLREDLLQQEISNLKQIQQAEIQALDERISTQRELGRLVLQGPEEFQKAIKDIGVAQQLFGGITDVNTKGLEEIVRRVTQLRDVGNFEALQQASRGLENAIKTGRAQLVSGVENKTIQRVFEQALSAGLQGGTSADEIYRQLEEQKEILRREDRIQKQIESRQQEMLKLAQRRVELARAEAEANDIERSSLVAHQTRIFASAQKRLSELERIRKIWEEQKSKGIQLATSTITALRDAVVTRREVRRERGIIISGASSKRLGTDTAKEISKAGIRTVPTGRRTTPTAGPTPTLGVPTESELIERGRVAAAKTKARQKGEEAAAAAGRSIQGQEFMKNIMRLAKERLEREIEYIQDAGLSDLEPEEQEAEIKKARARFRKTLENLSAVDVTDDIFKAAKRQFERALERSGGDLDIQLAAFDDFNRGFVGTSRQLNNARKRLVLLASQSRKLKAAFEEAEKKAKADPKNRQLQTAALLAEKAWKRVTSLANEARGQFKEAFKGSDEFVRANLKFKKLSARATELRTAFEKAKKIAEERPDDKAAQDAAKEAFNAWRRVNTAAVNAQSNFKISSKLNALLVAEADEQRRRVKAEFDAQIKEVQETTRRPDLTFTPTASDKRIEKVLRALQARLGGVREATGIFGSPAYQSRIDAQLSDDDKKLIREVLLEAQRGNDALSQSIRGALTVTGFDFEDIAKRANPSLGPVGLGAASGKLLERSILGAIDFVKNLKKRQDEAAASLVKVNQNRRRKDISDGRVLSQQEAKGRLDEIARQRLIQENRIRDDLTKRLIEFGLTTENAGTATREIIQQFKLLTDSTKKVREQQDLAVGKRGKETAFGGIPGLRKDIVTGVARDDTKLRNALDGFAERITFGRGGRGFRVRSIEQQKLLDAIEKQAKEEGAGPTRAQERELRRVQQRDLRRTGRLRSFGDVVRQLFKDDEVARRFRQGFGGLLGDEKFFGSLVKFTGARERRGRTRTRGRAAQEISIDALRQLLGDAGLSAVADTITDKQSAKTVANLLFELKEVLSKNDRESKRRSEEILRKFTEIELKRAQAEERKTGGRAITGRTFEEGEVDIREGKKGKEDAADRVKVAELLRKVTEENTKTVEKVKKANEEHRASMGAIFDAFGKKLDNIRVKTEDINFKIAFSTDGGVTPENFAILLADQFRKQKIGLNEEQIKVLIEQIILNSKALFERGLIGIPLVQVQKDPEIGAFRTR